MQPLVSWLHLSDIHFGHGDAGYGQDQALVLDALLRDLPRAIAHAGAPPDLLLVTGDIAFSGGTRSPKEYVAARTFLLAVSRAAGVAPNDVFVVPGNHDVQRSADHVHSVGRLVTALRGGGESLEAALADPTDRRMLAGRLAGYLSFAADFAPACRGDEVAAEDRLWWSHRENRRGLALRLIGLNTALLCADDRDRGALRVGNSQISRTLLEPAIEPDELVVVLSHHPFTGGWLADEDAVRDWLRSRAHIHLSGHVHVAEVERSQRAGSTLLHVVAGAAHGEHVPAGTDPRHGYNLAAVRYGQRGELVLRVIPRRWANKAKAFRVDIDNVPEGAEWFDLPLPGAVPPKRRPGASTVVELWSSLLTAHPRTQPAAQLSKGNDLVGQVVGNYVLGAQLGAGGTGMVFRARHRTLHDEVALKLFYPLRGSHQAFMRAIERGARGLRALRHPGIVSVIDLAYLDIADGIAAYMVMDLIDGKPLDAWSCDVAHEPSAAAMRLAVAGKIAAALHAAHTCSYLGDLGFTETGVLHGDVKPSNILVRRRDAQPVVVDFMMPDVQRRIERETASTASFPAHGGDFLTSEFGTPDYMPPEQAQQGVVSPASDIHALGKTLRRLFRLWRTGSDGPSPVIAAIEKLLTAMTASDPADRPPTMAVVHARLQQLLEEAVR